MIGFHNKQGEFIFANQKKGKDQVTDDELVVQKVSKANQFYEAVMHLLYEMMPEAGNYFLKAARDYAVRIYHMAEKNKF